MSEFIIVYLTLAILMFWLGYMYAKRVLVPSKGKKRYFPPYVQGVKGDFSCICLHGIEKNGSAYYYRHAGEWRIRVVKKWFRYVVEDPDFPTDCDGIRLVSCSREEWLEDNKPYVSEWRQLNEV